MNESMDFPGQLTLSVLIELLMIHYL